MLLTVRRLPVLLLLLLLVAYTYIRSVYPKEGNLSIVQLATRNAPESRQTFSARCTVALVAVDISLGNLSVRDDGGSCPSVVCSKDKKLLRRQPPPFPPSPPQPPTARTRRRNALLLGCYYRDANRSRDDAGSTIAISWQTLSCRPLTRL